MKAKKIEITIVAEDSFSLSTTQQAEKIAKEIKEKYKPKLITIQECEWFEN